MIERDDRFLHGFFTRAAERWPERIAVDVPPAAGRADRRLVTYAQLDRWSDAIAHRLQDSVIGECVVAILLPRTDAVYAAQLAVLKAGAAYTCVDPEFPDERARWILDDSQAVALVTNTEGIIRAERAGWTGVPLLNVDVAALSRSAGEEPLPPAWLTPATLAYVIYTSGTTGEPKGVAIEHRGIANLVASDLGEFQLTPDDRVAQSSSTSYDSSIEELWLALAAGATVVVLDDDAARLGPDLIPWLRRERVSVFCPPPTLLRATGCGDPQRALPDLKLLYVGGEALPRDVADLWAPGRRLSNGYGPTECSVTAIRGDVRAGMPVSIGRPAPGLFAVILDDSLDAVAEGAHGELCLGGVGLARGYWMRPNLTTDRFIVHPRLGRLYRTGDLAHQDAGGEFFCHGRFDSQVKIRGYRIELDEIESRLQACAGVRAAACAAEVGGAQTSLVAFIVPDDPARPPTPDDLRSALRAVLPSYMVPARFEVLAELPTTIGGKLNRDALPKLGGATDGQTADRVAPETAMELTLDAAIRHVLGLNRPISMGEDFFNDLGGDSLAAALLVTRLRDEPSTAWVAVRDIYEARTVAELARRTPPAGEPDPVEASAAGDVAGRRSITATLAQSAWLLGGHMAASIAGYLIGFVLLPWLMRQLGLITFVLLAPALGAAAIALYAPLVVLLAVTVKRVMIGRYRPMVAPVWSGFYLRHWIVLAAVRLAPWRLMQGTIFQVMALRALGAKIGRRVHIHRGVDLIHGGWDLLELGDDVTIGQDATIGLVELDGGRIVVGPVTLGDGATLDVRAGVSGHTLMEQDAHLAALSSLPARGRIPRGERWDGIPARCVGRTVAPPAVSAFGAGARVLSPVVHGIAMIAATSGVALLRWLPPAALTLFACVAYRIKAEHVWSWIEAPASSWTPVIVGLGLLMLAVPLTLLVEALLMRLLGRVTPGVISRWSAGYIRVWIKTGVLQSAGNWLSGTLFWPVWLRAAGMAVGPRCEISTITDVVPELLTLGPEVFFADGIYLGGPRIQRGTVTLASTSLGPRTFLGNHVVIPAGRHLPGDILLGVSTVADDEVVRGGSSWFGHPPFELPRREAMESDRRLTHEPSLIRYWNRVFWETLRVTLPVAPVLAVVAWFRVLSAAQSMVSPVLVIAVVAPLAALAVLASLCALVLVLKWVLLGRVRPGRHPLWSCWCSRWDFLYVVWNRYASPSLSALEGTLLLPWYLRAMGMQIGTGVVLGPGFAQVVDPDMIEIGDGATVHAMFQAHTFEDRVLKIDRVRIRRQATVGNGTVVLYGADIGEGTHVAPHSVVMKHERLAPGRRYEGAPTRAR